jgi:hypothetical protein
MKPASNKLRMSVALVGIWAGCDAQTGEPYRGEPLLTMTGSVELALEVENQDALIPTLAFRGSNDDMHLAEAEVEGEFPAEFTLNVYEPPPAAAVQSLQDSMPPGPRFAIGYISAVTPDTPDTFRYSAYYTGNAGNCRRDEASGEELCEGTRRWCTDDETACYVETVTCPTADSPAEDCTVVSEGDPQLKLELWQRFAGLSENYMVLWLESAAPPRSWFTYVVGERDRGLAQGYHLLAIEEATQSQDEARVICEDEADEIAATEVNDRFDTSYALHELAELCQQLEPCDPAEAELETAFRRAVYEARVELDCPLDDVVVRRIAGPANEKIAVRIGPDLKGF